MGVFSNKKKKSTKSESVAAAAAPKATDPPSAPLRSDGQNGTPSETGVAPDASLGAGQGQQGEAASVNAPKKTVSQVLGEVVWLLTQSQIHKQLFIGDLEWFIMPPVLLEQFRIFHGEKHPVGVALWARVSEDTDSRLREGAFKLRPDEWKGGSIPWLIELIAPFGGHEEIMADLSLAIFPTKAFSYHKIDDHGKRVVATFEPKAQS